MKLFRLSEVSKLQSNAQTQETSRGAVGKSHNEKRRDMVPFQLFAEINGFRSATLSQLQHTI